MEKPSGVSCIYVNAAHLSLKPPPHTPRGTIGLMFRSKPESSPLRTVATLITFSPLKCGQKRTQVEVNPSRGKEKKRLIQMAKGFLMFPDLVIKVCHNLE